MDNKLLALIENDATLTAEQLSVMLGKEKGDVVDEWVRFSVTKAFNNEKEPDSVITISYDKEY